MIEDGDVAKFKRNSTVSLSRSTAMKDQHVALARDEFSPLPQGPKGSFVGVLRKKASDLPNSSSKEPKFLVAVESEVEASGWLNGCAVGEIKKY